MPRAIWNGKVIAETDRYETVEDNIYFPPESLKREYFQPNQTRTLCPWKGHASYYDVVVERKWNRDAAWYYPDPKPAAANIKNYVAFWHDVIVEP